jgi:hypothetical protein
MGFYQNQIVPILTDLAMRQQNLAAYRNRVVPATEGRVSALVPDVICHFIQPKCAI